MTNFPNEHWIGQAVGASRWPYHGSHPDCWGTPWKGSVLPLDDVRVWVKTGAFPTETPDPDEVARHVQWCLDQGLMKDRVPVLWDFDHPGVHWEQVTSLRSYQEDLRAWEAARIQALTREMVSA